MSRCYKIILFYLIFYAAHVRLLEDSLINPGLEFRPLPPDTNLGSTLIWYKSRNKGNIQHWQDKLRDFVEDYKKVDNVGNVQECEYGVKPAPGKVCDVHFNDAPCTISQGFNYNSSVGGPCIFLKLSKIYGWIPDYYNSTDLPENMPEDLKEEVRQAEGTARKETVWVSCEGENPADVENIGSIQYKPSRGFPGQYFPFVNTEGYLSPAVAVYFESPTRGMREVVK